MYEPTRMCIICRCKFPKKELTRYVLPRSLTFSHCQAYEKNTIDGNEPIADTAQILDGRGFYLCHENSCQDKFQKLKHKKLRGKKV